MKLRLLTILILLILPILLMGTIDAQTTTMAPTEMTTGTTTRVSVASDGTQGNGWSGYGNSRESISANGRYVAFGSDANNLVPGDTNGAADVFVHDRQTGQTSRVSVASDGTQGNGNSGSPSISADGRYVAFDSFASSLSPGTSLDLRKLFVRDRTTNTLLLASISTTGLIGNAGSWEAALASGGRYVAYTSNATNLVANDTNERADVFLHDFVGPPSLNVNYSTGAPGSFFVFNGSNWEINSTAVVSANGVTLGTVNTNSSGSLTFQIISTGATQQGVYAITVTQGANQISRSITVRADAPLRPGSGDGFILPNGIALDESVYLPIIRR